jgi:acyl-CoA synthetase (AMP-forming)/AMP-acid ligase II
VVVLAPGAPGGVAELASGARARLSAFKVPVCWRVIATDEIPTTATGKVDQSALRRLLEVGGTR